MNKRGPHPERFLPWENGRFAVTQVGGAGEAVFNENKSYKPNLRGTEVARGLVDTHGANTEQDTWQLEETGNSLLSTMAWV